MADGDRFLASDLAIAGPLGAANARNNKGRSRLISFGQANVINGQQVARRATLIEAAAPQLQHRESIGDALSQSVTISCSYNDGNPANAANPVPVIGHLEWGCDGHRMSAAFDWRHGTVVRCAGSSFRLTAEAVVAPDGETVPESIALVGAVIGYHHVGTQKPQLTDWLAIAAASSVVVPVPPFAAQFSVPTSQAVWSYQFNYAADGSRPVGVVVSGADLAGGLVRVVARAPFITFFNGDGVPNDVPVVWMLDL